MIVVPISIQIYGSIKYLRVMRKKRHSYQTRNRTVSLFAISHKSDALYSVLIVGEGQESARFFSPDTTTVTHTISRKLRDRFPSLRSSKHHHPLESHTNRSH